MKRIVLLALLTVGLVACGPQSINESWVADSELRIVCYDLGTGNTHNTSCFQLDTESFTRFVEKNKITLDK